MSGGHILTATMCETREQARFRTVGDLQRTAACMMRSMTGRKARVREGTADQPDLFVTHTVDRVPTTAAVDASGDAFIWEGMPPIRLVQRWRSFVNQP